MVSVAIVLQEHPGSTIVTDSVTSNGLAEFIAALGGRHHRFKRGYKNVINEGIKLNAKGEECHLAIETSGHGAMKENYFLDDGAYLVVKVLIQLARLNPPGATKRISIRSLFAKYGSRAKNSAIVGRSLTKRCYAHCASPSVGCASPWRTKSSVSRSPLPSLRRPASAPLTT